MNVPPSVTSTTPLSHQHKLGMRTTVSTQEMCRITLALMYTYTVSLSLLHSTNARVCIRLCHIS